MSQIIVTNERIINASPSEVYAVLSDYNQRQQFLPENFHNYTVEKGGHGAGTVVQYRLHAAQRERDYRLGVEEVIKGRVIRERDFGSSFVITWTLSPENGGSRTRVGVASEWTGGSGVGGFFERTFAPMGLRNIYDNVLDLLNARLTGEEKPALKTRLSKDLYIPLLAAGVIIGFLISRRRTK
ncbi:SRPBCC family protein [Ktedonospora formicarum]|uniref:Polyketide cyclase n=1 Tax=Ktedonospora formicarum TaxID=2778364 RepID=A0A8J3I2M6_9CHLR|nr:SRPBCC family protein [Ktedonospora formicarum]GHO44913.1 polyketide cyclase [Ktedonospora formicarum]